MLNTKYILFIYRFLYRGGASFRCIPTGAKLVNFGHAVNILIGVGNVQEIVLLVMFLVQGAHGSRCWWNDVVHKEEEGILGTQVDALANEEVELTDGQVGRHQVLLLVQITDARLGSLLDDDGHTVWIFATDLVALGATLLEGVLLLVLELHDCNEEVIG